MNEHTESVLATLDVASATLTVDEHERAAASLERILATAPTEPSTTAAPARPSRRRRVLVPATALALVIGAVVVIDGGGETPAYASWTATPAAVASDDLHAVAAACGRWLSRRDSSIDAERAYLALSERRGDYVALLYRTDDPDMTAACLARNPQGSDHVDDVTVGFGGSTGPALEPPPGGFTQGAVFSYGHGASSITEGAVGEGVRGVVIHAGDLTISATVEGGRYAAWWPGPAFEDRDGAGGGGGQGLLLTYDLILDDGTVVPDADPALPS